MVFRFISGESDVLLFPFASKVDAIYSEDKLDLVNRLKICGELVYFTRFES